MKTEVWGIIFNASDIRIGRVTLSVSAFLQMKERKLNLDQLEEIFRFGDEVKPGKIEFSFGNFKVGMYYVKDEI